MNSRTSLAALSTSDCLSTPSGKLHFNQVHFAESARHYDFATVAMSLGQDAGWKRQLIALLPPSAAPNCLDLACGTGDLTFALGKRYPAGQIIGLDVTESMLKLAAGKNKCGNVRFVHGDMCALPYPDNSFDIITGGYALRNAPQLEGALREIRRVLRPEGVAAFLDFSKPTARFLQLAEYWILRLWCGFWGLALHGTPKVHGYISDSLKSFPDRDQLSKLFSSAGFKLLTERRFLAGITNIYLLQKENPLPAEPDTLARDLE